jgi:hypothetical protein
MLFQRINRSDPEKVFIIVKNSYTTASLTNGQPVMWDYVTDGDGVGVTLATAGTAKHGGFVAAGVVSETITAGSYGLVQIYGYHSSTICQAGTTPATTLQTAVVATGTPLGLLTAAFTLTGIATSMGSSSATLDRVLYPCAFSLGAAVATWTTGTGAVFIKAM